MTANLAIQRSGLLLAVLIALVVSLAPLSNAFAAGKHHKVVIHITENDPKKMNMVLNIIQAVTKEYQSHGDTIEIEVVAHGPGLDMMRADKSPVRKRIGVLQLEQGNVKFSACGNTMARVAKQEGKEVKLIPEAKKVPSGIFRVLQLQDAGWNYIRP